MTLRFKTGLALFIVLVSGIGLYAYLFRSHAWDNEVLGAFTLRFSWGKPSLILLDVNRDGTADTGYYVPPGTDISSRHWEWSQGWESTQCDGVVDLRMSRSPSGNLVVRFDRDRDGIFEHITKGEAAEKFMRDLDRPPSCQDQVPTKEPTGSPIDGNQK